MKKCFRCQEFLSKELFGNDSSRKDGLDNKCLPCARIINKNRGSNPKRISARKRRYIKNRESYLTYFREWYKKNKKKKFAQVDVTQTLIKGILVKSPCEVCEKEDVIAHHDDYNKPLDVRWLCRSCHSIWHRDNLPLL